MEKVENTNVIPTTLGEHARIVEELQQYVEVNLADLVAYGHAGLADALANELREVIDSAV